MCANAFAHTHIKFAFRFDGRRARDAAFSSLLGLAAEHAPVTYNVLVSREARA